MTDSLIEALRVRAAHDAEAFREKFPGELPNLKWVENSYTAALPLAKESAGVDAASDGNAPLFDVYRSAIAELLGGVRPDAGLPSDVAVQEPTRGEG